MEYKSKIWMFNKIGCGRRSGGEDSWELYVNHTFDSGQIDRVFGHEIGNDVIRHYFDRTFGPKPLAMTMVSIGVHFEEGYNA